MKILTTNKFSHKEELAKTLKVDRLSLADFPALEKYANELDNLRAQITWARTEDIPVQKANTTSIQERIENYIRIMLNLAMYVDIPKKQNYYNFEWRGNIRESVYRIKDMDYEISAMFFNLGVIYFNQASGLLRGEKPEEMTIALKYFRCALWSFNECNKSIRKALANGTPVPELGFSYIAASFNVTLAHAYRCLYLILRPNFGKFSLDQQTSFHRTAFEAYKGLWQSKSQLREFNLILPEAEQKKLAAYQAFHDLSVNYQKAKEAEMNHKERLTGGFNGLQIAYITQLKGLLEKFKKEVGQAPDKETAELLKSAEGEVAKLKDLIAENNEIYNAKVPNPQELPVIPESQQKINALDQPHVKAAIEELAPIGAKLKSSEYKTLENDLELIMNKNKQNLSALIDTLQKTRADVYKRESIDVMLRIANADDKNNELDGKLKEMTQVFGGVAGYQETVNFLKNASEKNDVKARELKSLIENDVKGDRSFLGQFGYKLFGLDQPGNQLVSGFEKHGVALTSLRQRDQELLKEWTSVQAILTAVENGSLMADLDKMKATIGKSEELGQLANRDRMIAEVINKHLKPTEQSLNEYIQGSNVRELIRDVFFNRKTTEEVYKEINENVSNKIEEFREKTEQLSKAVNKMGEIAQVINKKAQSASTSLADQQKVLSDVNQAYLYHASLMTNNTSNESLLKNAEYIEQVLKDYLYSKDLQKQEITKNLQAFQNLNIGEFIGSLFNQPKTKGPQANDFGIQGMAQQPPGFGQPPTGFGQPPTGFGQPPSPFGQPPTGYGQPPSGYGQGNFGQPPSGYGYPPNQGWGGRGGY